jgi:hypothetical protein
MELSSGSVATGDIQSRALPVICRAPDDAIQETRSVAQEFHHAVADRKASLNQPTSELVRLRARRSVFEVELRADRSPWLRPSGLQMFAEVLFAD